MVNVLLVQTISTGFPGAPGYTTFAFNESGAADRPFMFEKVWAFWDAIKGSFPTQWSVQLQQEHRMVDEVTGALVDIVPLEGTGVGPAVAGTSGTAFGAGVAGAVVSWRTLTNNRNRRVRGRTFLVPLRAASYGEDGTLAGNTANDLAGAANTHLVIPENDFGIWSRPRNGTGGKFASVTAVTCRDRVAYLSTRRT